MKVYLYYYEYNLGYLEYVNEKYVWNPYLDNITKAKRDYELAMDYFFLSSEVREYDRVPRHFDEYITDRYDLVKKSKILPTDNMIERLYKMSKLDYFDQAFVIKSK